MPARRAQLLLFALLCATSCSAPGLASRVAQRELGRTRSITSTLSDVAKGETMRAKRFGATLGKIPSEIGRVRRVPEILRNISSEAARPKRGLARALEMWRRETKRLRAPQR